MKIVHIICLDHTKIHIFPCYLPSRLEEQIVTKIGGWRACPGLSIVPEGARRKSTWPSLLVVSYKPIMGLRLFPSVRASHSLVGIRHTRNYVSARVRAAPVNKRAPGHLSTRSWGATHQPHHQSSDCGGRTGPGSKRQSTREAQYHVAYATIVP